MSDKSAQNKIPHGFALRYMLQRHQGTVFRIAWSPDGQTLASTNNDGTVRLWDVRTGQLRRALNDYTHISVGLAWSPDGQTLALGGSDGTIQLWNVDSPVAHGVSREDWYAILSIGWSPGRASLVLGNTAGHARLWEMGPAKRSFTLGWGNKPCTGVAWSPDGQTIAFGENRSIHLWDPMNDWGRYMEGHSGLITSVAWSPDGQTLASGSEDRTVRLWDMRTGKTNFILQRHTASVSGVCISSDGLLLASKSLDGTVRISRCDTGNEVAILQETASRDSLANIAFHPHVPVLATLGEEDRVIRIWDLNFDAIQSAAPEWENIFYTTAKITLVGDSGAGKTGLGWRLTYDEFQEHPSTHGQQFWVLDALGATRPDGTQCEAVLWDLAGQPDYRLVHALFLDDVDLALVLFDPASRQEPLKGVEYWLKQLSRARRDGRKRRAILVGARADRGVPTLTPQELEEFCKRHGVEGGYVSTSALTGEGLGQLLERMKALIAWDEMPPTVTTKTFRRIKEFVLTLKADDGRTGVLVAPAELRKHLEVDDAAWEFTDDEMMTAVRHLSNHGYVSVLRSSSGEETILLKPDMLTNLASSLVLEARRNDRGLGALEEERVLRGDYQFPEFSMLEKRERDVLLDAAVVLFLENNLCFRETRLAETLLIFPALINQKRPQENKETVDDSSYRVTGAVENVYAALVVLLGYTRNFKRTNQWQNQAEYETAYGDVCGFRQTEEREGEVEFVIYHAKETVGAGSLFQRLFEEFLRGRDVTATRFPPVQCRNCSYRQPRSEIIKRIDEGKGSLFCGECGAKNMLPKEGERVALSSTERDQLAPEQERTRRRTAFEAALVRVKATARDEKKAAPSCFISYAWGDDAQERWVHGLWKDLENAGVRVTLDRKDNPNIGANIARFISDAITESDFVIIVGTPEYWQKYKNKDPEMGSVVASEVDLVNERLIGATEAEKATVLTLLLEGDKKSSLPPTMWGKVYADFRHDDLYFASLFDLVLTLYGIPFGHPAMADLRDDLRVGRRIK